MRLLVVSHACSTAINQSFYADLEAETGWQVSLVIPSRWSNQYGITDTSAQMAWLAGRYQTRQRVSARQYPNTPLPKLVCFTAAGANAGCDLRASRAIRPFNLPGMPGELPYRQETHWLLCCPKHPESLPTPDPPNGKVGVPPIPLCVSSHSKRSGGAAGEGVSTHRQGASARYRYWHVPSKSRLEIAATVAAWNQP